MKSEGLGSVSKGLNVVKLQMSRERKVPFEEVLVLRSVEVMQGGVILRQSNYHRFSLSRLIKVKFRRLDSLVQVLHAFFVGQET